MATTKIGAGTTINITIPLDKPISQYENIFLAIYTDERKPVKFSYLEREGFNKLDEGVNPSELVGVLEASQSSRMKGLLWMEMKAVEERSPSENIGNSIPTKIKDSNGFDVEIIPGTLKETL